MNLIARNNEIRAEFRKMEGVKKYLHEYIYRCIADKYHISPGTVETIVWQRGYYKDK